MSKNKKIMGLEDLHKAYSISGLKEDTVDHVLLDPIKSKSQIGRVLSIDYESLFFLPGFGRFLSLRNLEVWLYSRGTANHAREIRARNLRSVAIQRPLRRDEIQNFDAIMIMAKILQVTDFILKKKGHPFRVPKELKSYRNMKDLPWVIYHTIVHQFRENGPKIQTINPLSHNEWYPALAKAAAEVVFSKSQLPTEKQRNEFISGVEQFMIQYMNGVVVVEEDVAAPGEGNRGESDATEADETVETKTRPYVKHALCINGRSDSVELMFQKWLKTCDSDQPFPKFSFVERSICDHLGVSDTYPEVQKEALQVVPVVSIMNVKDANHFRLMTYLRAPGSGETRNHGKVSVCFGGHVEMEDFEGRSVDYREEFEMDRTAFLDLLTKSTNRELMEELRVDLRDDGFKPDIFLSDKEFVYQPLPVDKVHFGLVQLVVISESDFGEMFERAEPEANEIARFGAVMFDSTHPSIDLNHPDTVLEYFTKMLREYYGDDTIVPESWAAEVFYKIVSNLRSVSEMNADFLSGR